MKKRQSSFTFTSLYIGLVAASLLGILVSVIVVLYHERKEGLNQHQLHQVALQQYLQTAHEAGRFAIDDLFDQFPSIHFLSIQNNKQEVLASAAQDRQSLWSNLPNSYQPRVWELAYYTQRIDNITIEDEGVSLHLFMVTDLVSRQSVYRLTIWALYGVLALLLITLIIALLANKGRKETQSYDYVAKNSTSPTIAYPDNSTIEQELAQAQEDWLAEPAILHHSEELDSNVSDSDLQALSDTPEEPFDHPFTTLEEPKSFQLPDLDDELSSDISSFDEELINDDLHQKIEEQQVFMHPADHLDPSNDDPQPLFFDQDELIEFTEHNINLEDEQRSPSDLDNIPLTTHTELEGLEMLDDTLFDDPLDMNLDPLTHEDELFNEPTNTDLEELPLNQESSELEQDLSPVAIEDELFNEPISPELEHLEPIQESPQLEQDLSPVAIEDELFNEPTNPELEHLEPIQESPQLEQDLSNVAIEDELFNEPTNPELEDFKTIPEEAVALTEYLEDELAKSGETTLLVLQPAGEYGEVFDVLMQNHIRTHFQNSQFAKIDLQQHRYALTLSDYDLETSYSIAEDFSNFFAGENLAFDTGLAAKAGREVSADLLLEEAIQALERAVVSEENGAIVAYKP